MTPHWAIETIARDIIHRAVEDVGDNAVTWGIGWEDFPDLGAYDWDEVAARVQRLAPAPDPGEYAEAYQLLARRADRPE